MSPYMVANLEWDDHVKHATYLERISEVRGQFNGPTLAADPRQ
jgi:hypothetical protein